MCFYDGGDCGDMRHKILPFLHKIFFINFLLSMFDNKCAHTRGEKSSPIAPMRFKVHLPMPQFAIAAQRRKIQSIISRRINLCNIL